MIHTSRTHNTLLEIHHHRPPLIIITPSSSTSLSSPQGDNGLPDPFRFLIYLSYCIVHHPLVAAVDLVLFFHLPSGKMSDLSLFVQFFNTCRLSLSSVSLNSSWLFLTSAISLSISPSFCSPAVLLAQILCNISVRSSAFFSNFFSMSCKMEKSNLCPC